MLTYLRSQLPFVLAITAAFALGGGTAVAAGKIGPHDIADNAIHSNHIKNGQVRNVDLHSGAVTGAKVRPDTLTGSDINESTLGQVPDAATVDGLGSSAFLASKIYKTQSVDSQGTDLGDGTFTQSEACNPGDILLSGGPADLSPTTVMVESFPTPNTTNSWSARVKPASADVYTVVVLCVDMTP